MKFKKDGEVVRAQLGKITNRGDITSIQPRNTGNITVILFLMKLGWAHLFDQV